MTVPSDTQKITYIGAASTATYAATDIKIFDEDDLDIFVTKLSDLTETDLVINTDYTVTDVGIAAGPIVTLVNASQAWLNGSGYLTASYSITIKRSMEIIQETSVTSQGQNLPEYMEKQFDRSIMIDQQQQEQLDRCLKLPASEVGTATNTTLPTADLRANSIAAYDEDGDPTTAVLSSVGANTTASYVAMSADASIPNRRLLTGTANQITVTDNGAGSTVVLSIPSNAAITTANTTVSALTAGRVVIAGTAGILEDDAAFTYAKATDILTVPVVKFTPGSAPSLANGQQWSDSTQLAPSYRTGGITEYGSRIIYSQSAAVTVANTTSTVTLLTTPNFGTNVTAAGYLSAGKTLRMTAWGTFGITGTPTLTLTAPMTISGSPVTLGQPNFTTAASNSSWKFEQLVTIQAAGASGTVTFTSSLYATTTSGASPLFCIQTAPTSAHDMTVAITWGLNAIWGTANAANTLTCYGVTIEVLG